MIVRRGPTQAQAQRFLSVNDFYNLEPGRALMASNTPTTLPPQIPVFIAQGAEDELVRRRVENCSAPRRDRSPPGSPDLDTKACSPAATSSASPHRPHVRPSGANGASRNHTVLSMLRFYINRAGKSFPDGRRRALEQAKIELRNHFGRE